MNMISYSCCNENTTGFRQVSRLSSLLKLVGEENRLEILCILKQRQHCVCEIEEHVSQSQSLISHHLKDLKDAGLIVDEKKGLKVHYSLTQKGDEIVDSLFKIKH